jgi:hypothetical protein
MYRILKLSLGALLVAVACGGTSSSTSTTPPPTDPTIPTQPTTPNQTTQTSPLNLSMTGPGSAEVRTSNTSNVCSGSCTLSIQNGSTVLIIAHPENGATFQGFNGPCSGIADCSIIVNSTINVTIVFNAPPPTSPMQHVLSVTRTGNGSCTVQGGGIDCGTTCQETVNDGTDVVLAVTPDPDSAFTGWSGSCSGKDPTCSVHMDMDRSVSARCMQITCSVDP